MFLDFFLDELGKCMDAGLHYAGLTQALTLPDICGALSSPTNEAKGSHYRGWFDQYVSPKYVCGPSGFEIVTIKGWECWNLRCSFLHQGKANHQRSLWERIFFVTNKGGSHNNYSVTTSNALLGHMQGGPRPTRLKGSSIMLNVYQFVQDVCDGVTAWNGDVANDKTVLTNYAHIIRPHPPNSVPGYLYVGTLIG